jgi:hypothetical protein
MSSAQQTFNCRIEMSKEKGIKIRIVDLKQSEDYKEIILTSDSLTVKTNKLQESATITQTEKSVVTEVKDAAGSTKIEQGPADITVTCKKFKLNAENIEFISSQDTKSTATGKYTVESTQDYKVESSAKCDLKSTGAMTLDATAATQIKSAASLGASAPQLKLEADTSFDASSSGAVNIKGSAVSIKGDMRAELDSPSTTVGSAMTTVSGQIVSVTGSLVKLG